MSNQSRWHWCIVQKVCVCVCVYVLLMGVEEAGVRMNV